MSFPRTTAALRAALEAEGLRPRKGHGFLTDAQAVDAIVRDAGVAAHDRVIEVGTGPGLLTHALAATGAEVVTFDIDPAIQALARRLADWPERVRFEVGDVLAGKHALAPAFAAALASPAPPGGRRLLVSNLPYGAGTPILLGVLALPEPPDEITVMVQLEVAEKLLAGPEDPEYGAPSIVVGLKASGRILRRYGPQVFWPQPKVRSALLRLVPTRPARLAPHEHAPFGAFVTALFSLRRKVLSTSLAHASLGDGVRCAASPAIEAALAAAGARAGQRPQELLPEQMLALWRHLCAHEGRNGAVEG
jgi:16S rRNA (adenine1518-N6/adenine1519-N6)-dimethyltransferase